MEWVLTVLILLGFIVDIVLYILATGKFARVDTRVNLFTSDAKVGFQAAAKRMDLLSGRIDKILEVLEVQKGDIGLLASDINNMQEEMGDIKLDISGLQNASVNNTRPLETVPAKNKGGRPSTRKVG